VSEEYREGHIRVMDGIQFELVGDDWFPVTVKDSRQRRYIQ
jgi:hypothetical protein